MIETRYLDIYEVLSGETTVETIRTEVSGIIVTDEPDAVAKLADYVSLFDGLKYEAFYHRHFHSENQSENQPCLMKKLN